MTLEEGIVRVNQMIEDRLRKFATDLLAAGHDVEDIDALVELARAACTAARDRAIQEVRALAGLR